MKKVEKLGFSKKIRRFVRSPGSDGRNKEDDQRRKTMGFQREKAMVAVENDIDGEQFILVESLQIPFLYSLP
ncbi:hypothetical protein CDL12_08835 [Handroanthus impetiginosus]|uniref:Uncharacterized protein n=1 Tax=Handroanthus impetiginosus TaxID=429701 RepID=A0A2G9HLU2_9LAMI|nr:hypothetical protein CDL12_08835 [Handroanthus impetiginosus]